MDNNALWALTPVSGKIMQEGLVTLLQSKSVQDALTVDNLVSSEEDFELEQWGGPVSAMIEVARTEYGREDYETRSLEPGNLPAHMVVRVTLAVNREMLPRELHTELHTAVREQDAYDKRVKAEEEARARAEEIASLKEQVASAEARLAELESKED